MTHGRSRRWGRRPAIVAASLLASALLAAGADCSGTATGLIPLTELGPGHYHGFPGGLYGSGSNARPPEHEKAGRRLAAEVVPRDAHGTPSPGGRIVLLSIGMSNTTQEFQAFLELAAADSDVNPALTIVDGAKGGQSADRILRNPGPYWEHVAGRLAEAGVTSRQVQVVWMKQAHPRPSDPFPVHAQRLQADLAELARVLKSRFPELRLLYLSSRTYGGYASTALNPEPYAYESGFSVKWVIDAQISGDPELNYDPAAGPVKAPWLSWGPYLWADGEKARSDGLTWSCSDFGRDGTHPSASGRWKVARMLLDFFKTDPTARPWFLAPDDGAKPEPKAVANAADGSRNVARGSIVSLYGRELAHGTAAADGLPLPRSLAGVSVLVNGEPAPLYFVSPQQVNLVLPPLARTGTLEILRGRAAATMPIELAPRAPALFVLWDTDPPRAAALHADGSLIGPDSPARPGETIMLFGTGIVVPYDPTLAAPLVLPTILVGGVPASVKWLGPAPGFPGLDQVNIEIPADAPPGATVPVTFGGYDSPRPPTLAIAG